jgi:hypothetical protein
VSKFIVRRLKPVLPDFPCQVLGRVKLVPDKPISRAASSVTVAAAVPRRKLNCAAPTQRGCTGRHESVRRSGVAGISL